MEVAALTGISDKAVGDWRCILSNAVANWFLNNSTPLGGPGKIVEVDEAKFGKRKYNKGAYREEQLNKSPYKQKLKALKQEGKLLP